MPPPALQRRRLLRRLLFAGILLLGSLLLYFRRSRSADEASKGILLNVRDIDQRTQKVFEDIYKTNWWSTEGGGSGWGSEPSVTKKTRKFLKGVIQKYGIRSMVDLPCGSLAWMSFALKSIQQDAPDFRYYGGDIVQHVIERNQQLYANESWAFSVFDIARSEIPAGYDLIFSRDALQHLNASMIVDALKNFVSSSAKYLLVGSYEIKENKNFQIENGGYFRINLLLPPYNFPQPLTAFDEDHDCKRLLLYELSALAQLDFQAIASASTALPLLEHSQTCP